MLRTGAKPTTNKKHDWRDFSRATGVAMKELEDGSRFTAHAASGGHDVFTGKDRWPAPLNLRR
jgi:hypothetical protein